MQGAFCVWLEARRESQGRGPKSRSLLAYQKRAGPGVRGGIDRKEELSQVDLKRLSR